MRQFHRKIVTFFCETKDFPISLETLHNTHYTFSYNTLHFFKITPSKRTYVLISTSNSFKLDLNINTPPPWEDGKPYQYTINPAIYSQIQSCGNGLNRSASLVTPRYPPAKCLLNAYYRKMQRLFKIGIYNNLNIIIIFFFGNMSKQSGSLGQQLLNFCLNCD